MRRRPGSEAEMVALFLRTELASAHFGDGIRALLERDGLPDRILTVPASAATPRTRCGCGS